jgi:hypothetical protein
VRRLRRAAWSCDVIAKQNRFPLTAQHSTADSRRQVKLIQHSAVILESEVAVPTSVPARGLIENHYDMSITHCPCSPGLYEDLEMAWRSI